MQRHQPAEFISGLMPFHVSDGNDQFDAFSCIKRLRIVTDFLEYHHRTFYTVVVQSVITPSAITRSVITPSAITQNVNIQSRR